MSLYPIIEAGASLIETFWGIYVPAKVFGNGKVNWKVCFLTVVILTGLVHMANQYIIFSVAISLLGILLMALSARFIFKASFCDTLALISHYMILIYVIDFLSLSLLGTIIKNHDFANIAVTEYSYQRVQFLIVSKVILSIVCFIFIKYMFKKFTSNLKIWLGFILEASILYYLINSTILKANLDVFLMWFLLFSTVFLGMLAFSLHLKTLSEKERKMLDNERNKMLATNYELMLETYQSKRIFYHDLKNQYLVILNLLENKEYEKAKLYMESLKLSVYTDPIGKLTKIDSLDILLEYKKNRAESLGIRISIIAEPICLKLSDSEIVSLFGNIFDNAIDACREVEGGEKWIQVIIRNIKDMIFIKMSNSYVARPIEHHGIFLSRKENRNDHGLGLSSTSAIVKNNNGIVKIDYDKGIFSIVITFFG